MVKSVLILSDSQLVTGLAILIAGYSQLNCGITAYHWQIMVFVAWFSTFTFLSAMAFLEGYFQENNNLRTIRLCFMFVLAGLQIAALLPTGSRNWLDLFDEGGGFYPSLSAECYFEQLSVPTFLNNGPRIWSMIFSVLVVGLSYIHSGVRLFDPTAEVSRKYLRAIPGSYIKKFLFFLERRATQRGVQAALWIPPYAFVLAGFSSIRALYDFSESMLAEIIWLAFAIAWGTIKVWDTRQSLTFNFDGERFTDNNDMLAEDSWSFGQTLPLVLLLLPVLAMTQSYLDNDAKAQEAAHNAATLKQKELDKPPGEGEAAGLLTVRIADATVEAPDPCNSTSYSITRYSHHQPSILSHAGSTTLNEDNASTHQPPPFPLRSPLRPFSSVPSPKPPFPHLPRHPYPSFIKHPWYRDHIALLISQALMLGVLILFIQDQLSSILGISAVLRNRLFLIWIFGVIPLTSLVHLSIWYLAACMVRRINGAEDWLNGKGRFAYKGKCRRWWRQVTIGRYVYFGARFMLVGGCLLFTFFISAELAGPNPLYFSF